MSVKNSFFTVCDEAKPAAKIYVSLYISTPFYGGSEEGGWWGSDVELVASQPFMDETAAESAKKAVDELTEVSNDELRAEYGEQCQKELDFMERNNLGENFLPEVDGEAYYFVSIETIKGEQVSSGTRQWS
jgi:hypothetical protein